MLSEIQGDLFATTAPVIAHGVNCRGAFGSGVAAQVAKRFPEVREAYLAKWASPGWRLGETQLVKTHCGVWVANLATQAAYGRRRDDDPPFASAEAIETSLALLLAECQARGVDRIAMPRIGCGLGGLSWDEVRPIVARLAATSRVSITVYGV